MLSQGRNGGNQRWQRSHTFISCNTRKEITMAGPIYKAFMGRPTEAWYQLSEEEQNSLDAKTGAEQAGGKTIVLCRSAWSNERWLFFGIEEYPDIETVQKATEALLALDWYRYVDSVSLLGTRLATSSEDVAQEITSTGPIYKLWMGNAKEAYYRLSDEERRAIGARRRAVHQNLNRRDVLNCQSAWCSEQWPFFGLEEFDDIETAQKKSQGFVELNHYRYYDITSILGTKWEL